MHLMVLNFLFIFSKIYFFLSILFIFYSTSNLRRMRLVNCPVISDRGLCEVVKKLPLLEELEISYRDLYEVDTIKFIGRSCPRLKKLKINNINPSIIIEGNDEARTCYC